MRLKNSYINYPRYGYAREKRELENGGGGELYTWMNKRIYIGRHSRPPFRKKRKRKRLQSSIDSERSVLPKIFGEADDEIEDPLLVNENTHHSGEWKKNFCASCAEITKRTMNGREKEGRVK